MSTLWSHGIVMDFCPLRLLSSLQKVQTLLKCSIKLHFIWVFTVCQSTHLGVSSIQWVNLKKSIKVSKAKSTMLLTEMDKECRLTSKLLSLLHVRVYSVLSLLHVRVYSVLSLLHVRVYSVLSLLHVRVSSVLSLLYVRVYLW